MGKYLRRILVVFLLFSASFCSAQIEVSSGIDLTYPILINSNNSKLNYSQISFGLGFGIAYKPPETQFFPILRTSLGRTKLPLFDFDKNITTLSFNYWNEMLNENFILRFPTSEVFIYGGIGFTYLAQKSINIAGPDGESMKAVIDSTANITHFFPAINIGFEYNYGESAGKPLYLTIGLNFQYVLLLSDRNTYYVSVNKQFVGSDSYTKNLSGNLITPFFYIAIHYLVPHFKKG
jgi:hypothetical protein